MPSDNLARPFEGLKIPTVADIHAMLVKEDERRAALTHTQRLEEDLRRELIARTDPISLLR